MRRNYNIYVHHQSTPSHGATTLVLLGTAIARQEVASLLLASVMCMAEYLGTSNCLLFLGLSWLDRRLWRATRFGVVSLQKVKVSSINYTVITVWTLLIVYLSLLIVYLSRINDNHISLWLMVIKGHLKTITHLTQNDITNTFEEMLYHYQEK